MNQAKNYRIYSGTLAAGALARFSGIAETFYIISATGILTIKPDNMGEVNFPSKSGVRASAPDQWFQNLTVQNNTGASITYSIFYGFGWYIDNTP